MKNNVVGLGKNQLTVNIMDRAYLFSIFILTITLSINGQETNQQPTWANNQPPSAWNNQQSSTWNSQASTNWNQQQNPQANQPPSSFNDQPQKAWSNPQPGWGTNTWGTGQSYYYGELEQKCPKHWIKFQESCYRFIRSPFRRRDDARRNCQAYQSDLVSVNSVEEHGFLLHQLQWQDPQHRAWYTGARQVGGYWANDADGSQLVNMENAFLPEPNDGLHLNRDALAYNYSYSLQRWGLEKVVPYEHLLYICEAPISVLQNLAEDDRDYTYGIEIDNPKEIPRGPYFIKQPVDQVFDPAKKTLTNDVVLSCLAGGYPTPTYEWFREDNDNGRLFAQAIDPLENPRYTLSGGNFIIYNPNKVDDYGTYHCKASNKFGVIMSESVRLSFAFMNEFNLKRSEESGDQNWGKVMYCDPPAHNPSVKYYWSRGYFPNFVEEDKRVFVSDDGALYFAALEPIDGGNYSCNLQGISLGRNGPFFPLRVNLHSSYQQLKFPLNFPKVFPTAPIAGEEVRMECIAFGYPVASYNWTRKGTPLPRSAKLNNYNRVLLIPRVRVEDQGEYICRAFNERTSIENSVFLTVQANPNFTIPLEDKHVDLRSDLTWTCEAFGNPDVIYHWFRNGQLMENTTLRGDERDRFHIQDNVLKIDRVEEEDAGMYQCRARNQLKATYSSGQLRVLSMRPSFKKHPMESETYAADRGNVTIVCNPEAAPRPNFVWKKDDIIIGAGGRRRILPNGNLIISPVSVDDEGLYACKATNKWGTDETRGRLFVLRGPTFYKSLPERAMTVVMYNHTFVCEAATDEKLDIAYIWKHNGIRIRDKDLLDNPRLRLDGGKFTIINVTLADAGDYECTIKSAVGDVSSRSYLTVEGPPGPPGGVSVLSIGKTSAVLEWTDGALNGKPIYQYTVAGRTRWSNQWFNISENITAEEIDRYNSRKQARLEGVLNPYTTYEFAVSAGNEYGYGPLSSPSPQFSTSSDRPTKPPSNVGGGGGKIGDLVITWDSLAPGDQHGRDVYYKVFYRRKGETEFLPINLKGFGNRGMTVVHIPDKYYYSEYEVKVQAINEIGEGPVSEIATIFSAEDMPQVQPQQVSSWKYNSTSLNVSWTPIDESREIVRGKLIGYRLKYWPASIREEQCTYYLSRSKRPWSLIVGLLPNTEYYVKVMAYNSNGAGPESERWLERTYRKAPQNPPSSVFVAEVNPSTVKVTWRYVQPSLDEEPLDGFKIRVWETDQDMSVANDTIVPHGGKLERYITGLSPGKTYNLRVLGYSQGGDGRMSSPPSVFQMGDPAVFRSAASNKILDSSLAICLIILLWRLDFV